LSIVLDTNVLVSALLQPASPPGRVLDLVTARMVDIALDERVLTEYREVLLRSEFSFPPLYVHELLDFVWLYGRRTHAAPFPIRLPDADDVKFIEVALSAGASALVTGNLRHYPPDHRHGVRVMTPREFLGTWADGLLERP
jgi:putative PIN family toxin of toxin-antitoxin system